MKKNPTGVVYVDLTNILDVTPTTITSTTLTFTPSDEIILPIIENLSKAINSKKPIHFVLPQDISLSDGTHSIILYHNTDSLGAGLTTPTGLYAFFELQFQYDSTWKILTKMQINTSTKQVQFIYS